MLRRYALFAGFFAAAPLAASCWPYRVGPAVEVIEPDDRETAEKNLAAVRAIAREWSSLPLTGPPAEGAAPPQSLTAVEKAPLLRVPPGTPPSEAAASPQTRSSTALPWVPPQIPRPSPPDRPVPAYTVPAPTGPQDAGSTRCVPDGLGGQRCLRP
ncbi:hypothetical protein [Nitrospira moscoviensis]|uniref:Uncharacterized protein n=1 Tax=Nitrospira moscoviensis TaxID=42253 RepID=A0A0K2GBR5_NITMO|nr:hypothetical protein [Nitrospira moscoviensis]ALA58393.1 exported protein of unknown function [Nitrospira moscoviensis]